MAAICHVKLSKMKNLTLSQVLERNMHHRAKFNQNRSKGCRDMTFNGFQNGGRPPS